jgi:hypothetical protein
MRMREVVWFVLGEMNYLNIHQKLHDNLQCGCVRGLLDQFAV